MSQGLKIRTSDFPQADNIEGVFKLVEGVNKGHRTYQALEEYIGLSSEGRQGRYYRATAENCGLIINSSNSANLTHLGTEFVSLSSKTARLEFFAMCLSAAPLFERAIKYVSTNKPNPEQLRLWHSNLYPGKDSTGDRRYNSFLRYITQTNLIEEVSGKYIVKDLAGAALTSKVSENKTLSGRPVSQIKGLKAASEANAFLQYNVSMKKRERANYIHKKLVAAKSDCLTAAGFKPLENAVIDLFAIQKNDAVLYEMKSISQNKKSFVAQMRKAISQLYEYRFIYSNPKAKLCIVTHVRVPKEFNWMKTYLCNDRDIAFSWSDDFKTFNIDKKSKNLLGQFAKAR